MDGWMDKPPSDSFSFTGRYGDIILLNSAAVQPNSKGQVAKGKRDERV